MIIAIWVIAVCEVIRMVESTIQLRVLLHDTGARDDAYRAFVDSLKDDDKEFVEKLLREFEEADEVEV